MRDDAHLLSGLGIMLGLFFLALWQGVQIFGGQVPLTPDSFPFFGLSRMWDPPAVMVMPFFFAWFSGQLSSVYKRAKDRGWEEGWTEEFNTWMLTYGVISFFCALFAIVGVKLGDGWVIMAVLSAFFFCFIIIQFLFEDAERKTAWLLGFLFGTAIGVSLATGLLVGGFLPGLIQLSVFAVSLLACLNLLIRFLPRTKRVEVDEEESETPEALRVIT